MERRKKRLIAGLTATGVLAGALAWGGTTIAAAGTTPSSASLTAATATTGTAKLLRLERAGRLVAQTAAAYDGLSTAQLKAQLKAGKSLAAVATAQGKSVAGLESAIEAALINRIDASKLTAARKAALITDVKTYLDAFVSAPHPFASLRGAERAFDGHAKAKAKAKATPTATGSTSAASASAA